MLDRLTDSFFWPALIGAWLAVAISILAAFMPRSFDALLVPTTVTLGTLAGVMFAAVLLDAPTRRAIAAFNLDDEERSRDTTWKDRLFSSRYGDFRLLIVNRIVWLVGAAFIIADRQDLALLCIVSFALSGLMLMLMFKRHGAWRSPGNA